MDEDLSAGVTVSVEHNLPTGYFFAGSRAVTDDFNQFDGERFDATGKWYVRSEVEQLRSARVDLNNLALAIDNEDAVRDAGLQSLTNRGF
jgi:hypothetical protein